MRAKVICFRLAVGHWLLAFSLCLTSYYLQLNTYYYSTPSTFFVFFPRPLHRNKETVTFENYKSALIYERRKKVSAIYCS